VRLGIFVPKNDKTATVKTSNALQIEGLEIPYISIL
jgi:hypothetical protein